MKKNYIAPAAALVNFAAEDTMLTVSIPFGGEQNGVEVGSNALDVAEDWED